MDRKGDGKVAMFLSSFFFCLACASSTQQSPAGGQPAGPRAEESRRSGELTRLLEQPAVSREHVAFAYAGDLWIAKLDGSDVRRLTSHPGSEGRPRFSPDGKLVAFTGQYEGNIDVYLIAAEGGVPQRLTWHPGIDAVRDFAPDGSAVLFISQRSSYTNRFFQLYTVPIEGGFETKLPLPNAFKAAYSPDGKKIAYTPLSDPFNQWKNYRGGTATRIWIYDVADHSIEEIPQLEGRCNDTDPMWLDGRVCFRSDRDGEFNLYSYDSKTKKVARLTQHADFPVLDASAGAGRVVYEQAGWLHVFDPAKSSSERIPLRVTADLVEVRPRFVKGKDYVRSASISPSGKRAAFDFRGEIVTLPAEKGDPHYLTRTPAVHERYPAWSPDGKSVAYVSDEGGENQLHVAPQDGRGEVRRFALGGAGFYVDPDWSPDGKRISFVDNSRSLFVLDLESGAVKKIAQEPIYGVFPTLSHAWSPDSRWIAYTLITETNFKRIHLYDVQNGVSHALTDALSDASEPVFDRGGKYLYFAASTDAGPVNTWFAQSNADMELTNALYLAVLATDVPSPLAKESDEEGAEAEDEKKEGEKKEESAGDQEAESKEEEKPADVKIDVDGLAQRIVAFPLPAAFYTNLEPGEEGQLFYIRAERANLSEDSPIGEGGNLARFELEKREEKKLLDGVQGFSLSKDASKILLAKEEGFWIVAAGDTLDTSKGQLAIDAIEVKIDPRAEWAQIFDEAWRINRDYFYDPNMHGCDWPAMKEKYAQFLPHLTVRSDLNRVIRWMCSELAVGHHYGGGGDTLVKADTVSGGLLGADYEIADGRYRFKKIYGGLNWNPDLRAPLTEPGVDVRTGEYLLAVNGVELRPPENLYARFENTAEKQIEITVGPSADASNSRTVKVVPIAEELALRNRDWVEGNIRKVTDATQGRVAYVHVPDTATLGHTYFKRYFFPQSDRQAIIIDERHNGGGSVADYYIDILRRPYISHWTTRYGKDIATPQGAIFGPKVMLIDETAGSGGDLLPWMFRKFELGKLVGRPTWGGLVGILGFPELMDGGAITAPNLAFWSPEEGFGVENVGVSPDIEVEQLPSEVIAGRDPQLEKAIEVILAELEKSPPQEFARPSYPIRVRR